MTDDDEPDKNSIRKDSIAESLGKLSAKLESLDSENEIGYDEVLELIDSLGTSGTQSASQLLRPVVAELEEDTGKSDEGHRRSRFGRTGDTEVYSSIILLEARLQEIEHQMAKLEQELSRTRTELQRLQEWTPEDELENVVKSMVLSEVHSQLNKERLTDEILNELSHRISADEGTNERPAEDNSE